MLNATSRSLISRSGCSSLPMRSATSVRSDLGHRCALAFGSSASRTTSPSMMNASTVTDSAIDG